MRYTRFFTRAAGLLVLVAVTVTVSAKTVWAERGLTDSERAEVRQIIRKYVAENPEKIRSLLKSGTPAEGVKEQSTVDADANKTPRILRAAETIPEDVEPASAGTDVLLPSVGPADAPVTIVEILDYNCPYCRDQADILARLVKERDDVRVVYRPVFSSESSILAAVSALAVYDREGTAAFQEVHSALMDATGKISRDRVIRNARQAGVSPKVLRKYIGDGPAYVTLERNRSLAEEIPARKTPTLIINGRKFVGVQDFDTLTTLIEATKTTSGS